MTNEPFTAADITPVLAAEFGRPLVEGRDRDRRAATQLKNLTGDEANQAYRNSQS